MEPVWLEIETFTCTRPFVSNPVLFVPPLLLPTLNYSSETIR